MSEAPVILHTQTGLTIKRNAINKFCVVTLHYTADPAKRSAAWKDEAARGMIPEKFQREYEINYTAVLGAKVFPEFTAKREAIIVEDPLPDFGPNVRYWGGLDYGTYNAASFHVYTIVEGVTYSVFEIYHPCDNIPKFAQEMKEFPYWSKIRYIACDPDMMKNKAPQASGELTSVAELFAMHGVNKLVPGSHDEIAWVSMMRQHWNQDEEPTFRIFNICHNQIREFELAIYTNQSERQLMQTSYKEQIRNKDNHSLDDCKYFMLSHPNQQAQSGQQYGRMVDRWAQAPNGQYRPPRSQSPIKGYV